MSVKKPGNSPFYHYAFEYRGHRFHGSTKATSKRAAEEVERPERDKARAAVDQLGRLDLAPARRRRRTLLAGDRQHHAGAANTWKLVERLVEFFGKDRLITDITGDDVAQLVAWRRGQRIERGGKIGALRRRSPSTTRPCS